MRLGGGQSHRQSVWAELDRRIEALRAGSTLRPWLAVVTLVLLGLGIATLNTQGSPTAQSDLQAVNGLWLDVALEPLERELAAVGDDAQALVEVVWEGMPKRVWEFLGE